MGEEDEPQKIMKEKRFLFGDAVQAGLFTIDWYYDVNGYASAVEKQIIHAILIALEHYDDAIRQGERPGE